MANLKNTADPVQPGPQPYQLTLEEIRQRLMAVMEHGLVDPDIGYSAPEILLAVLNSLEQWRAETEVSGLQIYLTTLLREVPIQIEPLPPLNPARRIIVPVQEKGRLS